MLVISQFAADGGIKDALVQQQLFEQDLQLLHQRNVSGQAEGTKEKDEWSGKLVDDAINCSRLRDSKEFLYPN